MPRNIVIRVSNQCTAETSIVVLLTIGLMDLIDVDLIDVDLIDVVFIGIGLINNDRYEMNFEEVWHAKS